MITWETIVKDKETKILIERSVNKVYVRPGGIKVFESEMLLGEDREGVEEVGGKVRSPRVSKEGGPKLFIASGNMTKGEFRAAIFNSVEEGGKNPEKVNAALQATNRRMRKEIGGLDYSLDWVKVAVEIYKTL